MQNNFDYFEVTINNKYESATAKRKELKNKLIKAVLTLSIICGLMIFSESVSSSSSEVRNKEDIKWESDIFPLSTPDASVGGATNIVASEPSPSTTKRADSVKTVKASSSRKKKDRIKNQVNSSENQNVLKSSVVASDTETMTFAEEKGVDGIVSNHPATDSLYQSLTTEEPIVETYDVSIAEAAPHIDSNEEYAKEEEKVVKKIEEREKRIKEERERNRRWDVKGGLAGINGIFDDVNNSSPVEKKAYAIWKFLLSAGFSKGSAAGVLGNIEQESTFNTYCRTGKYSGLFQLSVYDRFSNTEDWCYENGFPSHSIEGQIRFMLEEMRDEKARNGLFEFFTGYSKTSFTKIKDPETAAYVFCAGYEGCISGGTGRSATWQQLSKRQIYARKWYEKFKDKS